MSVKTRGAAERIASETSPALPPRPKPTNQSTDLFAPRSLSNARRREEVDGRAAETQTRAAALALLVPALLALLRGGRAARAAGMVALRWEAVRDVPWADDPEGAYTPSFGAVGDYEDA